MDKCKSVSGEVVESQLMAEAAEAAGGDVAIISGEAHPEVICQSLVPLTSRKSD